MQLLTWNRILFYRVYIQLHQNALGIRPFHRENTSTCQFHFGTVLQDKVHILSFLLHSGNVLQDKVHILSFLLHFGNDQQDIWYIMMCHYTNLEDNSYIQGHLKIIYSQKMSLPTH